MIEIPQTGLGTWQLREPQLTPIIEEAIKTGYRHFDGAAIYENEAELGKAFENLIKKDKIIKRDEVNLKFLEFSHFYLAVYY